MEELMRSLPLVLTLLAACDPPLACDDVAVAAVQLAVVDPAGAPIVPDAVTFTVDGGEVRTADCFDGPCTSWVVGWEVTGTIEVTATLCGNDAVGTVEVILDDDGCHPVTQDLTLTVDPAVCDTGDLELPYSWGGFAAEVASCADAGTNTLYVRRKLAEAPVEVDTVACDDAPVTIEDLRAGSWTIEVATVEDPSAATEPYATSGPVEVDIVANTTTTEAVVITCDENGWDDGCGGA